eukprot:1147864-Pelagomonas_calceolata.AAC.5
MLQAAGSSLCELTTQAHASSACPSLCELTNTLSRHNRHKLQAPYFSLCELTTLSCTALFQSSTHKVNHLLELFTFPWARSQHRHMLEAPASSFCGLTTQAHA